MKKIIALVISLIASYFTATPVGQWFASKYAAGGFLYIGPFPGFDQGFLFSYIFFSSLIFSILTRRLKWGFYGALPVLIFDILVGAFNPQLWLDLILLAAGLGLAYLILLLTHKAGKKIF